MKYYILPVLIFVAALLFMMSVNSASDQSETSMNQKSLYSWCNWLQNASEAVAVNRDLGISKLDLIQSYLLQNTPYSEQRVIIDVIDRAYSTYKNIPANTFANMERDACDRSLKSVNHQPF